MKRSVLWFAFLLFGIAVQSASVAMASPAASGAMAMLFDDGAYADGTKAMNEQRWQDAVLSFDKVIQSKDKKTDAALYWKAYSLKKLDNMQATASTCDELKARFSASTWNRDCSALTVDAHVSMRAGETDTRENRTDRTPDQDLKILAMNSLLNQDPAKAIPILREMLTANQPPSIRKHALFVLAQSKSPEAEELLHDAELGKMGPAVQHDAIQAAGVFLGKKNNGTLVEIYKSTSDTNIKRSVLSALFVSQDAPRMVDLARNEKDIDMKRKIVSQLAIMHDKVAEDYMLELLK